VKNRIIDIAIGLLLFGCGLLVAWGCYAVSHIFAFLGEPPWWKWVPPVALGCAAAITAIALCFRRRSPGIVGSLLMLALALWFLPAARERIGFGRDEPTVNFYEFFLTTAPLLLIGALVYWRFVKAPRAKTPTI
jgi:hypothetical protein